MLGRLCLVWARQRLISSGGRFPVDCRLVFLLCLRRGTFSRHDSESDGNTEAEPSSGESEQNSSAYRIKIQGSHLPSKEQFLLLQQRPLLAVGESQSPIPRPVRVAIPEVELLVDRQ